ncbi:imidazolonepropionase-like amidohydrolase [Desulfosalsimonas propionicica]|uniref:Imidazolonepropionase-like amidohydrolase n=1 Tax=Desulfosalsimonas propionicica TaxID=332175 RepID=A0A7W0CC38_9BACT|nr:amidohydrolase family protein [Desulfosalsimonas propionicica]MBA2882990.1 imidazolonepropionase-like amidohydrolase [Desulfosalsimonas propionicica]
MNRYVIHCGTLIDGTGAPPVKNARLIVENDKIARIEKEGGNGIDEFSGDVDARTKTVMPGLIDSHKHIFNNGGPTISLLLSTVKRNAKDTIMGGVTSCLDLGSASTIRFLQKLPILQPRIFYAISILTCKGGYPAEYFPKLFYLVGAGKEVATKEEIRKAVRKLVKRGVSAIKTVNVSRTFTGSACPTWTDTQLTTLTDAAHSHGLKVCSHITYPEDYAQAIRCGVDSLHHAAFEAMKEEDLDAMVEKGITFVPTLSLFDLFVRGFEERWCVNPAFNPSIHKSISKAIREFTENWHNTPDDKVVEGTFIKIPKGELKKAAAMQIKNLKAFVKKGGVVAMGTDASLGFSFHTTPVRELELMEACGMSRMNVIKASTLTAASVFGKEHEIGSLEPGKYADILVINGDPLSNISDIKKIETVIKGGNIVKDATQ